MPVSPQRLNLLPMIVLNSPYTPQPPQEASLLSQFSTMLWLPPMPKLDWRIFSPENFT